MNSPTYADAHVFMDYYALWDTPLDAEAWTFFRQVRGDGGFDSMERFDALVPSGGREFTLFDRVLCAFEQGGVLMKHGLMHPDLYFDGWSSAASVWARTETVIRGLRDRLGNDNLYRNVEWLAQRERGWMPQGAPAAD